MLSKKVRDTSKDFTALDAAGNDDASGIRLDGATLWVTDEKDYNLYTRHAFPVLLPSAGHVFHVGLAEAHRAYRQVVAQETPAHAGRLMRGGSGQLPHALSILATSTSYTYRAYSKAYCNCADEIAEATFTTP